MSDCATAACCSCAPIRARPRRWKAPRRVELTALQIALEGFAENAIPALHRVQLLRSLPQLRQEAGDPQVGSPCFVLFAMRAANCERHLPGMLGLPGDRLHQQGTAGD